MRAAILNIDVNRATCDPSLYCKEGSIEYRNMLYLDKTAQRIADFVDNARDYAARVLWSTQHIDNRPGHEKENTYNEIQFHRVQPDHMEDELLIKTRQSAYPENKVIFDNLKKDGVDTIILTGFYSDKCVRRTMADLLEQGFKVIVPVDLTAGEEETHLMRAFAEQDPMDNRRRLTDYVRTEQLVFSNADFTLHMMEQAEKERTPPKPVAEFDGHSWTFDL